MRSTHRHHHSSPLHPSLPTQRAGRSHAPAAGRHHAGTQSPGERRQGRGRNARGATAGGDRHPPTAAAAAAPSTSGQQQEQHDMQQAQQQAHVRAELAHLLHAHVGPPGLSHASHPGSTSASASTSTSTSTSTSASISSTADDPQHARNGAINAALAAVFAACLAAKFLLVDASAWGSLPAWQVIQSLPSSNWREYETAVAANPMLTKACISGVVYTLGDCIAQAYEGRSFGDADRGRVLRSGLCGCMAHGPLSHLYYNSLEHLFNQVLMVDPASGYVVFAKLAIDQTVWSVFWNSLYYTLLGALKLETPSVILHTVRSSWWDLLRAGWRLWPFAHVLTYSVIPVQHRLLWVDTVEILWVSILSIYGQQQREQLARQAAEAAFEGQPVTQVAVALPGPDGLGGDPAEEILRSIQSERQVLVTDAEGHVTKIDLRAVYAEKAAESKAGSAT